MIRPVLLATSLIAAAALSACGSGRGGDGELMRRVAQAEAAAGRAEAAAKKAEDSARRASSAANPSTIAETVYEPGPDMDAAYGQANDPVPEG